jgi:hypothetical protein
VRVDDRTVQVRHAGVVRGTWAAPAGTRVRVEIGPDGVVRYWSGGTRLDEVPLPRNGEARSGAFPGDIRGWLAAPHAAIAGATIGR